MKESAKVHREHKARVPHHLTKRLISEIIPQEESKQNDGQQNKRPNHGSVAQKQSAAQKWDEKMETSNA